MFTGIVESVGKVIRVSGPRLEIACDLDGLEAGASICVDGVCLTVAVVTGSTFEADLSEETIQRSTLGSLERSSKVNLERPIAAGGRFGGHFLQGHVDAIATVRQVDPKDGSVEMWIEAPPELRRYVVEKGSVGLDGISLTVTAIDEDSFGVSLVPHTLSATTIGEKRIGDTMNFEVDMIAKYIERLLGERSER